MIDTRKIEETILGSLLENFYNNQGAMELIRHFHFYDKDHQNIFRAIEILNEGKKPVDLLTVTEQLKKLGLPGYHDVTGELLKKMTYTGIETHCYLLLEGFLKREVEKLGATLTGRVNDPVSDVYEVINDTEKHLTDLLNGVASDKIKTVGEIKDEVLVEMETVLTTGRKSGVLCSIDSINKHTSGWQRGNLIIVAGRPGMGKTAVAIDFAFTPAINGEAVAFFSMEMPKSEITGRILSISSAIPAQEIINKTLDRDKLNYLTKNTEGLNGVPLFIDDTPALSLYQLRNRARKLKREKDIKLIVIDYLQLMSGNKEGNREQEISTISRGLKALAKELEIPVIALSQLSRKVEERTDKKPMLSDLRESGAIEQDADMVIFPFRPEYYGLEMYETNKGEIPTEGLLMFIIAKFRNGSPGEIRARFLSTNTMILNYH